MKKIGFLLLLSVLMVSPTLAQEKQVKAKAEVLYFKANLGCCKGRSCNLLQSDVDSVVTKYFAQKKVVFKVVPMYLPENKVLVEKYQAQSQTVVLVRKKGKKEIVTDLTAIVKEYNTTKNKVKFEADMKAKIKEGL